MRVPFQDFSKTHAPYQAELEEAVQKSLRSGHYILGSEVERFEEEFASYCGKRFCVSVGNGLDALRIALLAAIDRIEPGDEVVVPGQTYIATWLAVTQAGMVPVAVDVDRATGCLDAALVEQALSSRTRAILPVHLYGFAAEMAPLRELANRRGLVIVEDAAQAHGNAAIGSGEATAYSFYPTKNLGALGDGGAIVTDNRELAQRAARLRNYGKAESGMVEVAGFNSRLDELQAAILRVKLRHLDRAIELRRAIAQRYADNIALRSAQLPPLSTPAQSVWHLFPLLISERERLEQHLQQRGIQTLNHYRWTPFQQPLYRHHPTSWRAATALVQSEKWAAEELSLPLYPGMDDEAIDAVIEGCNGF